MWGDYIGKPLNEDTIQKIRWIDPNTIEEEEYYKLLAYGKFVAVKRQSGRKVVIGRIESNFNGKPLREWNNYDVYQWLNSRVNIRCFPSILSVLSNRGPQLLIDLEWLRKNLNEADFKTLEMELHKCLSLRLRKSLERQIVTFVDATFCAVLQFIVGIKEERIPSLVLL